MALSFLLSSLNWVDVGSRIIFKVASGAIGRRTLPDVNISLCFAG